MSDLHSQTCSIRSTIEAGWNFGGIRQYLRFSENFSATLHNFMRVSAGATRIVASQSDDLTRGGSSATFGSRFVFSFIERSTLSARFRLNYAFTPNFSVEGYAEPFAASGHFYEFGELSAPRSRTMRVYGASGTGTTISRATNGASTVTDGASSFTIPSLDFDRLSFRSNLVLRWEWLPGSTACLIWQQSRQQMTATGALINPRDLYDATRAAGDNIVVAKISYWFGVK